MSATPDRKTALLTWTSAFALYVLAYAAALQISFRLGVAMALVAGLANALPDAVATPVVLHLVEARAGRGRLLWLAPLAVLFVAWSCVLTAYGLAAMRAWETGTFLVALDPRSIVWKALLSLFVFGIVTGVGTSRFHARRAQEASARALRAETLRAEARLAILRAQLNPHFILNVLHSLVGLAERDPRATASTLERLGTTLRYALRVQSRGSDRVTLRDELAFTRDYLELERMRLGARLEARLATEGAPLDRIVPPFVLQPLVENAVVHAISPRARGGVVAVRISADGDALRICVEDDGDGTPVSGAPTGTGGLGLSLLRDRLDALYGANATLALDRSPLGGVRASLRLAGEPAARDDGEGDAE